MTAAERHGEEAAQAVLAISGQALQLFGAGLTIGGLILGASSQLLVPSEVR